MNPPALTPAVLQAAHATAARNGNPVLDSLGMLLQTEPRQTLHALAQWFRLPSMETADMLALQSAFDILPLAQAQKRGCVVLRRIDTTLHAVLGNPFDADLPVWLEGLCQQPLQYHLALPSDIHAYLARQEESVRAVDHLSIEATEQRSGERAAEKLSFLSTSDGGSAAVKLVNSTLYDALKVAASDIHLESTPSGLAVKYRIDGVLDSVTQVSGRNLAEQVISRLKVLAELDIAERRVPQDGSFRVEAAEREIDLRVSIMPSIHGEDAVIRILDKQAMVAEHGSLTLEALGFEAEALETLRQLVSEPYGMVLVTGPTGSGKTTTLYGAIAEINHGRDKIVTIEDPVEYQLPGILQIPVNEKKGLTFARGLRSILRHDPDKIMVGEIRDTDTAEIAVQSALTGHLVLTTVHANNVFDVFGRFTHMGIDPYAFVSALNGIWAQRLIRMNCPHCSEPVTVDADQLKPLGLKLEDVKGYQFRQGRGCGDCRGTGYKGRRAIAEFLTLTDELRELIVDKAPIRQIKEVARRNGTETLFEAALKQAKDGHTTLEEIRRVTLKG
ncbi:GspE/PulE family protein [Chitinimonas sp. PSY-7]|uniref:ATPase, T2SS/T4P/T4SS family n=1 Tax=Chitinimonas sp. PSY-7 TaxID=3459088 RepID=UPI00403FEC68